MDITGNDLHRESLKIVQKIEVLFFIKQDIYFLKKNKNVYFFILGKVPFKIPKNSFAEADTIKHKYASAKPSAFVDYRGEFRTLHCGTT